MLKSLAAFAVLIGLCAPTLSAQTTDPLGDVHRQINTYPFEMYVSQKYRQFFAEKIPPLLKNELEILAKNPAAAAKAGLNVPFTKTIDLALLALLEPESRPPLDTMAASKKPEEAEVGTLAAGLADFWTDPSAANQGHVLDTLEPYAARHAADELLALSLIRLVETHPASLDLSKRIDDLVTTKLHSPAAIKYRSRPNRLSRPLHVTGTTVDGKFFTVDKWKGKVVLVDFWATWCPPCREEIPHLVKIYQQYHAQGLEVVSASCDSDHKALVDFLHEHPEMAWPELFGPSQRTGWHVLAEAYGIDSIPRMYLLDKNGNLRSLTAREDMETLIPTLLAESATPSASSTPKP